MDPDAGDLRTPITALVADWYRGAQADAIAHRDTDTVLAHLAGLHTQSSYTDIRNAAYAAARALPPEDYPSQVADQITGVVLGYLGRIM